MWIYGDSYEHKGQREIYPANSTIDEHLIVYEILQYSLYNT